MSQTENSNQVFFLWMQLTRKIGHISQFDPEKEYFCQNCTRYAMFVFVKFLKRWFQRVTCNYNHDYLSLLKKDFCPFQSLKIILLLDQITKRNTVCKNALIVALRRFSAIVFYLPLHKF